MADRQKNKKAPPSAQSVGKKAATPPSAPDFGKKAPQSSQDIDPRVDMLLTQALSGDGVPWPHARVMVRGEARSGKTSTINAMAGRTFEAQCPSTVGASSEQLELHHALLAPSGEGRALRPYTRDGDGEYASALAAHAATLTAASPSSGASSSSMAPVPSTPAEPAKLARAHELIIKQRAGEAAQADLVLRLLDTGGQPAFLPLLELLTTSQGTVYVVVFSLARLAAAFDATAASCVAQLHSIQLAGSGAPILLVATHRDSLPGGGSGGSGGGGGGGGGEEEDDALRELSERLEARLEQQAAPALASLVTPSFDMCFFAVDNRLGFAGDATIRQLVGAIEAAARMLPSLQSTIPLPWLLVHDELRERVSSGAGRTLSLSEMGEIARRHGLPMSRQRTVEEV